MTPMPTPTKVIEAALRKAQDERLGYIETSKLVIADLRAAGFVVAPREATRPMVIACLERGPSDGDLYEQVWRAMASAAEASSA